MFDLYTTLSEEPDRGPAAGIDEEILLAALVKATGAQTVVETGTNRGLTTIALAAGCMPGGHVHTFDVDDYGGAAQQRWDELGIAPWITFYRQSSLEPPPEIQHVQCCFFDVGDEGGDPGVGNGTHTAEYLLQEWAVWRERLDAGAVLIWHDAPPGSPSLGALGRIWEHDDVSLCPLPTGCAMVLGVWRPRVWFDPGVAARVQESHRRRLERVGQRHERYECHASLA